MTNAELAILSLIAEGPRYGYEIEQTIEERGMRDWTEVGFSSIYYLLKKLEKDGFARGKMQRSGSRGPSRKVYEITPKGRNAQIKATIEVFSVARHSYTSILLGVANLSVISHEQAMEVLNNYCQLLVERRTKVANTARSQRPLSNVAESLFDYSLTMINAELAWVQKFMAQLETRNYRNNLPGGIKNEKDEH